VFIPRRWRRATRTARRPDGREVELTAWGWSSGDGREAEGKAQERLASLVARVEAGDDFPHRYPYGARPLREEVVEEIRSARLTPKPWRCGQGVAPGQHPREDAEGQAEFARWRDAYEGACADKAVCRWLEDVGWGRVHAEVRPILERHDQATRAAEALPLA
jgi:hypothetical protein